MTVLAAITEADEKADAMEAKKDFDPKNEEYLKLMKLSKPQTSCVELATAQIYMMISFVLNSCLMISFARTDQATDKAWSRIRIFNYLCIIF